MFSKVLSAAIFGMESRPVYVETDVSDGLPLFSMVGYLSCQVKEAQERVRTALKNSGFVMQPKKITVNLSPADLRKEGSAFDLPIAIGVLAAYGYIQAQGLEHILIVGELSLSGEVRGVHGILPMVMEAAKAGCRYCFIPGKNKQEGAVVSGIDVIGVETLEEAVRYLNGSDETRKAAVRNGSEITYIEETEMSREDFQDINGQAGVKRATEVAVAGMHNLLLIGPPGAGKSMIAKRIPGILPDLTLEESLEISSVYSIAGLLHMENPMIKRRPFRAPHHTISPQALAGGGRTPRPGEVSLSHRGILFLDEFPEFQKSTLEILRQPLEDHQICIARASGSYLFPANLMLVAAMNPCKCGYYPDMNRCTCSIRDVRQYLNKISQPLLDRIDISVEAPCIGYDDLVQTQKNESSAQVRGRVTRAHEIQRERYQDSPFLFNSDLDLKGMQSYCLLGKEETLLLKEAFQKLHLSARSYHRIIKVARTIADLADSGQITCEHIAEAVCYRTIDKKFWV